jgi:hypothetical protein
VDYFRTHLARSPINLIYGRLDTGQVFTREREQRTGPAFHRWADIATTIGLLDSERSHPQAVRRRGDASACVNEMIVLIEIPGAEQLWRFT